MDRNLLNQAFGKKPGAKSAVRALIGKPVKRALKPDRDAEKAESMRWLMRTSLLVIFAMALILGLRAVVSLIR